MGRSHNQDHYKVSGSEIESRGISARDRQRMSQEGARLQRQASTGTKPPPPPRPRKPARKAAAATRRKAKDTAAARPEIARQADKVSTPVATKAPERRAAPAEVVSIRQQQAARTSSVAPRAGQVEPTPGLLGQAMRAASLSGRIAGRLMGLAVDVVAAPWTIVRLVRQARRREA